MSGGGTVIVGAGIAGLSLGWELARRGHAPLLVCDQVPGAGGTSAAATGYLEPRPGQGRMHRVERMALREWPGWIGAVEAASGRRDWLEQGHQIKVAGAGEAERLAGRIAKREAEGWRVERLVPDEARAAYPWLSDTVTLVARFAQFRPFDPVATCRALAVAIEAKGGTLRSGRVAAIEGRTLRTADGGRIEAERIVLACGEGIAGIEGVPADAPGLRTVRGASLAFDTGRDLSGQPMVKHLSGHLCPRGRHWIAGATFEHDEPSRAVSEAVAATLRDTAAAYLPELAHRPFEARVGWRVHTIAGGLAARRSGEADHLWYSLGHAGVGFLRAPVVARLLAEAIAEDADGDPIAEADRAGLIVDPLAG